MAFKKGQSGNPDGRPETLKPWEDALMAAAYDRDEYGVSNLRKAALVCWAEALSGNMAAIKEIGDRLDGRPKQQTVVVGTEDANGKIQVIFRAFGDGDT